MKYPKNVEFQNSDDYVTDLVKSLSNFCSKCPLNISIKVMKDLGKIFLSYDDNSITITINPLKDKKTVIKSVKDKIEKDYPIIYEHSEKIVSAEKIESLIAEGKSLKQALECTEKVYTEKYKVMRVHHQYQEMDLMDLSSDDNNLIKVKCKIPLVSVLEDLRSLGKDADIIPSIRIMYSMEKKV